MEGKIPNFALLWPLGYRTLRPEFYPSLIKTGISIREDKLYDFDLSTYSLWRLGVGWNPDHRTRCLGPGPRNCYAE